MIGIKSRAKMLTGVFCVILNSITITAFVTPSVFKTPNVKNMSKNSALSMSSDDKKTVVVISPPGGIGEVAAVESAKRGAMVRWFVVSSSSIPNKITLPEDSLSAIASVGGKVDLAGSEAEALLIEAVDPNSAIPAVSTWCGQSDAIISCFDVTGGSSETMEFKENQILEDAIKVATKEACKKCVGGVKVAVSSVEDLEDDMENEEDGGGENPLGQVFSSLLSGNRAEVPSTLRDAMGSNAMSLRHGELFGLPESSVDASPFIGGPRRDPILSDEYTNRAIRLDSSAAIYSNPVLQSKTKSSRLSMGEAASLLALKVIPTTTADICLASVRGSERLTNEEWNTEFERVQKSIMESNSMSGSSSSSTELFSAEFGSVPNSDRLVDWLATKWAPAILRTYEIAGIRVGARPVYASRMEGYTVEIIWQQLIDFDTKTVGKILVEVLEDGSGLVAKRAAGNASQGYGRVSLKPLAGEDVIVRSLADATAQAIEKGLATKPMKVKAEKPTRKEPATTIQAATTVASSGSVATETVQVSPPSLDAGPRSSGARRSSVRSRGKIRKRVDSNNDSNDDVPPEAKAFE